MSHELTTNEKSYSFKYSYNISNFNQILVNKKDRKLIKNVGFYDWIDIDK